MKKWEIVRFIEVEIKDQKNRKKVEIFKKIYTPFGPQISLIFWVAFLFFWAADW